MKCSSLAAGLDIPEILDIFSFKFGVLEKASSVLLHSIINILSFIYAVNNVRFLYFCTLFSRSTYGCYKAQLYSCSKLSGYQIYFPPSSILKKRS